MATEVQVILLFKDVRDANTFREDVESEFECDIVEYEERDV